METIKNYFLKNSFDDQSVVFLRQKATRKGDPMSDNKEYVVLDYSYVWDQFSLTASQDIKQNWEAASYLPFKQCGGIFKVTYEKDDVNK